MHIIVNIVIVYLASGEFTGSVDLQEVKYVDLQWGCMQTCGYPLILM